MFLKSSGPVPVVPSGTRNRFRNRNFCVTQSGMEVISAFLRTQCERMGPGNTDIFDYVLSAKQDHKLPIEADVMDEKLITKGPANWTLYCEDCYQLYLWFGGWKGRPLSYRPKINDFVGEVLATRDIYLINNWRYAMEGKPIPKGNTVFNGKMFLGVRFIGETSGNIRRL